VRITSPIRYLVINYLNLIKEVLPSESVVKGKECTIKDLS
jgi:hypothetical protein